MAKPLSQLLQSAKYKHPDHAKRDILNATKYFRSLIPRLERYTFPTGVSKELICLDGTIPVTYRDASYNIPIGIFISDSHPFEAPICYVRPTRDMTIKTSRHVDGSGRVYLPYLSEWKSTTSDILSTIQVMQFVFGDMCPVYQKSRDDNSVPTNSYPQPPSLPDFFYPGSVGGSGGGNPPQPSPPSQGYPFSNPQAQPYSGTTNSSGTITEEHIRASLLSAVEDRLKLRLKERVNLIQDEIDGLKTTSNDLNRGKIQLDEMKTRMGNEILALEEAKAKLQELDNQLQEFITKYDKEGDVIDPDEVYGPTQPLFKQLLDAFAEENAIVDAIYYTGEGLRKGIITLDVFLKNVRELSRRQFMLRALMRACRTRASLPN